MAVVCRHSLRLLVGHEKYQIRIAVQGMVKVLPGQWCSPKPFVQVLE